MPFGYHKPCWYISSSFHSNPILNSVTKRSLFNNGIEVNYICLKILNNPRHITSWTYTCYKQTTRSNKNNPKSCATCIWYAKTDTSRGQNKLSYFKWTFWENVLLHSVIERGERASRNNGINISYVCIVMLDDKHKQHHKMDHDNWQKKKIDKIANWTPIDWKCTLPIAK